MRIPSWLYSVTRCRDCSVVLKEGQDVRCWYCAAHPYKTVGVCVDCSTLIPDQSEFRFKLYGNYCLMCDIRAENTARRIVEEYSPTPSLFA
jgi:hypothetical protein